MLVVGLEHFTLNPTSIINTAFLKIRGQILGGGGQ
jgi:hypothetical protein